MSWLPFAGRAPKVVRAVTGFILTPLNVLLATCAGFFWLNADYEDKVFESIARKTIVPTMTYEQRTLALLKQVHDLLDSRLEAGGFCDPSTSATSLRESLFPTTIDKLVHPHGACGTYAAVYARTCQAAGFPVRVVHLVSPRTNEVSHVACEVYVNHKWSYVDPLFHAFFRTATGELASLDELNLDWEAYLPQGNALTQNKYVAQHLIHTEPIYTNWSKIPVLLPCLKWGLNLTLGREAADHVSLRTYFLDINRFAFQVTLGILLLVNAALLVRLGRSKARVSATDGDKIWKKSESSGRWKVRRRRSSDV